MNSVKKAAAREFYGNVLQLAAFARAQYLKECNAGIRTFDFAEVRALDENIKVVEAEMKEFR
jgi:hypothetical protein